VVGLSPELFFRINDNRITVEPMKGTIRRGRTTDEDSRLSESLLKSDKERAENVMIVDLLRNDLGKICRIGSVIVRRLFDVKRFPSLWQMTSTIEGELLEEWTFDTVIRALFPSGSVTGAPKIRAMEHIAHLEQSSRGVYTGAIGYCAHKRSQFNVAIRTAVVCSSDLRLDASV
jgi:para-aminobenzoate synthetase/4-amino-4-deoxychorismate lyase